MKINRLILTLLIILLTSVPVSAATVAWDNIGTGLWSTSTNWSLDIVPGLADDVTINYGSGIITTSSETIIKTLTVKGSNKLVLSTGGKITLGAGPQDTLYVSSTTGSDGYAGTISAPKATIAGAITAVTGSITKIYVAAGTYVENVTLNNGVSLYGGFSATNWNDRNVTDRTNATYKTMIQGISTTGTGSGVTFSGTSTAAWILEGFTIESNHTGNSHGVSVSNNGTATVRYNTISGGPGTNESNGITVSGSESKTIITNNIINGGASVNSNSNGIYTYTVADQIITDNDINGGTGANASYGIVATYPLTSTSIIARNNIDGGSSAGGQSYGIQLANSNVAASSLNVIIHSNYIHAANSYRACGILGYGDSGGMSVEPGIFNNVIEASASGTGGRAYGIYLESVDGTPLVYNNTIAVSSVYDQTYGIWTQALSAERATTADIQNNIIIGESSVNHDFALVELTNGFYSNIKNNDIYNCGTVISSAGTPYGSVTQLNGLRAPATSGNIGDNPVLSASPDRNLTASSPVAVKEGGLSLSGCALFPENTSGQKIDKVRTVREGGTWSIGAYELNLN
jgi:hypothetical protein